MKNLVLGIVIVCICFGCDKVRDILDTQLTKEEVIAGLKEALEIGAKNSSESASKVDGFYKNPKIFIPWPPEAQAMKDAMENVSSILILSSFNFEDQIRAFEKSMNNAAEEAAKGAFTVFKGAITEMTIADGFAILNGADTAATHYMRVHASAPLKTKFSPIVKTAIDKVKVTSYWTPLSTKYNEANQKILDYNKTIVGQLAPIEPFGPAVNPNLEEYITYKAINGLMTLIADEEIKIRTDPAARVTDLLKKVFGNK